MALICLKIFFARLMDVSLGTIRTIILVKGKSFISMIIAFFEVLIWYYAAREALTTNIDTFLIPCFYSLGYATGTYIGSILSKYIIKGTVNVQIITNKATKKNLDILRKLGYAITVVSATDSYDGLKNKVLYIETNNKELKNLITKIKEIDASAFISVSETKLVENGFIK